MVIIPFQLYGYDVLSNIIDRSYSLALCHGLTELVGAVVKHRVCVS